MMKGNLLYSEPVESSDLGLLNWNCHCTWYFVFLCYLKPIIITQNQSKNKKKEWQINTNLKAKKLLKAVFCEWCLLHLMRKIKFLAFYFCCFCSHGTEHASLWTVERKEWNKYFYNIASKFASSNSIARACFIYLLCTFMTSADKSLEKKIFHRVIMLKKKWFIRQLCVHRLRLEQLLRIFRALQTSRVLHISMNARWRMNQL